MLIIDTIHSPIRRSNIGLTLECNCYVQIKWILPTAPLRNVDLREGLVTACKF